MLQNLFVLLLLTGFGLAEDPCAPECEATELLPHPQNCTVFYHCANGLPFLESCPSGLEFSPSLKQCVFPDQSDCTADPNYDCGGASTTSVVPSTSTTTVETETVTHTITFSTPVADPSTTHSSTDESTTRETTLTSAMSTTTMDVSTGRTTSDPSDCEPPCPSNSAIYGNPKDCSTFFICFNGFPYLQTCPHGQEYNPEIEACDDEDNFECTAGPDQPCVVVTMSHLV